MLQCDRGISSYLVGIVHELGHLSNRDSLLVDRADLGLESFKLSNQGLLGRQDLVDLSLELVEDFHHSLLVHCIVFLLLQLFLEVSDIDGHLSLALGSLCEDFFTVSDLLLAVEQLGASYFTEEGFDVVFQDTLLLFKFVQVACFVCNLELKLLENLNNVFNLGSLDHLRFD